MSSEGTPREATGETPRQARLYRWHVLAYCVLMGGLMAINLVVGGGWWSFWPMCAWGFALAHELSD